MSCNIPFSMCKVVHGDVFHIKGKPFSGGFDIPVKLGLVQFVELACFSQRFCIWKCEWKRGTNAIDLFILFHPRHKCFICQGWASDNKQDPIALALMLARNGLLNLSTLFLIRSCSAIYSSALRVLSLQTAVVGLILMAGLRVPQEEVG